MFRIALIACIFLSAFMGVGFAGEGAATTQPGVKILRQQWMDTARKRPVPVRIDYPADIQKPIPIVLLSHGLGGSREGLAFEGKYWAAHGYVTVHLQHVGSDESIWKGKGVLQAMRGAKQAESLEQFMNRVNDVSFAIDELARLNSDPNWPLHGKLDLSRIAMAGHSFGAVTTQAVCGQRFKGNLTLFDPRIKIGLVFSPSPPKDVDAKTAFAQMSIPMFYMTGTKDQVAAYISNVTPIQRRVPFDATTTVDEYLMTITGANHMVFNGPKAGDKEPGELEQNWEKLIEEGSTAFLDKYLKNDASQAKYLDDGGFANQADALGTFEMKKGKPVDVKSPQK